MAEGIRFSGLASGMDTQSIVESLMRAERQPLDRLKQNKQVIEWQRDGYREMNKLMKAFDQFIFDGIYRQSNMLKRSVSSSNSDIVSATAAADAGNVSYKIENITLAKAARRESTETISDLGQGKIDPSKSIWSQRDKFISDTNVWKQESITTSFTVPEKGGNIFQLPKGAATNLPATIEVKNEDGNSVNNYTVVTGPIPTTTLDANSVYIDDETGRMVFGENLAEGNKFNFTYDHNYLQFNIKTYNEDGTTNTRETDFKIAGTTSLNSMFTQINQSNVGINIFYDSGTDKVVAQRKETGNLNTSGSEMEFSGDSHLFFTNAGLNLDNETDGTDAHFTINGLNTSRKSNTFTMNDVTFTLKKTTATRDTSGNIISNTGESSAVNISTDTESIYSTIKDFVDKYNEMIGKINGELTAERFRNFTPLTDEQKTGMKDREIEQWEEKAKSGLLRRDSILTSGLGRLRTDLYAEVKSNEVTRAHKDYNQLAEIGITTSKDYLERGKLEINEDKLKAAIEDNPEAVYQLFMADGPTYEEKGLARRLRDTIDNTFKKVEEKAGNTYKTEHGYSMGEDLLRIKDDINSWEERLKQKEQRYWNQFNAMEKAMQRMNDQSNQLMSQLTSMQQ